MARQRGVRRPVPSRPGVATGRRGVVAVGIVAVLLTGVACAQEGDGEAGGREPGRAGQAVRGPSAPVTRAPAATRRDRATTSRGRQAPAPVREGVVLAATVTRVVDGDTITVRSRGFGTTVRLIGIDTPETRHPARPVGCFGPAASARARRLLPVGQEVRLVTDPTQDTRDRYGRLLAYVLKPGRDGPRGSVNHALVATGHAKVHVYGGVPFRHVAAFRAAERSARARGIGLWGPPCHGDTTTPAPEARAPSGGGGDAAPGCDPGYAGACVPPHPPDVDCRDVPGPVRVVGDDPHRLDGDGDGVGCD